LNALQVEKSFATEYTEYFARPGGLGQGEKLLNSVFLCALCLHRAAGTRVAKRLLQEV
jgi:hypothetical protein